MNLSSMRQSARSKEHATNRKLRQWSALFALRFTSVSSGLNRFNAKSEIVDAAALLSVFVFAAQLPLKPVDDALDAGLKNVGGDADGSPALPTIRKNR